MADRPAVSRFRVERDGASGNACLVETAAEAVAVDSLLSGNAVASRPAGPAGSGAGPYAARAFVTLDRYADIEVHSWEFGGRR